MLHAYLALGPPFGLSEVWRCIAGVGWASANGRTLRPWDGEATLNLANVLTLSRLFLAPVFIVFFLTDRAWAAFAALGVAAAFEATDLLDGLVARRFGQVSSLGKLIDPLADSISRFSVFLAFTTEQTVRGHFWPVMMVAVLFYRDALVAYTRTVAASTGVVLAASSMALWSSTFLLPALFLGSAVCTGVALLIPLVRLAKTPDGDRMVALLKRSLKVLLVLELLILVAYLIWVAVAGHAGALVSGTIGLVFWLGVVLLGLVVPLIIELGLIKRATVAKGPLFLASPLLVLLGGLLLRAVIVVAGQL